MILYMGKSSLVKCEKYQKYHTTGNYIFAYNLGF